MTLKIEKDSDGVEDDHSPEWEAAIEHLDELKTEVDGDQSRIALDLDGVTLVDIEIVRFLSACEHFPMSKINEARSPDLNQARTVTASCWMRISDPCFSSDQMF
jgi:hypothetical protein